MMNMKKTLALTLTVGSFLMTVGCTPEESMPQVESQTYTAYGRYYTEGIVITNDGNIWNYRTDIISDRIPYDGIPIWVGFDDNGTPEEITDDRILGLVYDRETAIYDQLEATLGEEFELAREGNNIQIGGRK